MVIVIESWLWREGDGVGGEQWHTVEEEMMRVETR